MDKTEEGLELNVSNVKKIFLDCLFKDSEIEDGVPICDHKLGEGILVTFGFNSERLKKNDAKIQNLIDQLPNLEEGVSFLNLCMTNDGRQWGEHKNVEQLTALGEASGNLAYCLPKDMWNTLPGGMPFILRVSKEKAQEKK